MYETNSNTKTPSAEIDPDQIARMLDLELNMKRVEWKKAKAKRRSNRMAAIAFLFLLFTGLAMAFLFFFSKVQERRGEASQTHPESAAPAKP